jgi:type II secretory pathway pseudopilin PulG
MKRLSSQLVVLGLIAALGAATAGSVQAAETTYQGVQNAGSSVQIAANDIQTGISGGNRTSLTLNSELANYTAALLETDPVFRGPPQNVALAANGAVAAASSTGFGDTEFSLAGKLIDDTRSGVDSYWTDDTTDEFPDVVQINFFGNKTIDRIVVYSVQEELNHFGGIDPTDTDNCYVYVLADFTVEGWNGNNWVTLATVADNDLCKRTVTFAPFSTDQIRINVTATGGWSWTRIAEVEAWEAQ